MATTLTKYTAGLFASASLLAVNLALAAPALAAPTVGTAQDTVNELQANGFKVILNKVGGAPLDRCTVSAVRPGEPITEPVTAGGGSLTQKVLYTTVYVTAIC
jgi:hypothetical protein